MALAMMHAHKHEVHLPQEEKRAVLIETILVLFALAQSMWAFIKEMPDNSDIMM